MGLKSDGRCWRARGDAVGRPCTRMDRESGVRWPGSVDGASWNAEPFRCPGGHGGARPSVSTATRVAEGPVAEDLQDQEAVPSDEA